MKKIFLFLFPLVSFAQSSYELYPSKECEALKADYTAQINEIQNLNGSQRVNLLGLNQQLIGIRSYGESVTNIQSQAQGTDFDSQSLSAAYATVAYANASLETVSTMLENNSTNNYMLGQLLTSVQNIDCGKCGTSPTNCCDFTEIETTLNSIDYWVQNIEATCEGISDDNIILLGNLTQDVRVGFGNVTNILYSLVHQLLLNRSSPISLPTTQLSFNRVAKLGDSPVKDSLSGNNINPSNSTMGYLASYSRSLWWTYNVLTTLANYQYPFFYENFPILTNTVGSISKGVSFITNELALFHEDTTNFFSFFRGEIGVQGVLADWQSEQVSGSYHDFLTNHYLTVVRGGSLSGNQSSKTNWFSRIETLLAALVFTDTTETNTVDTSAGQTERQQLATSYGTANQAAATFSDDFKTTSQSIVTLYQNYFTTFENASMPSHVVLMRLSNSDPSEEVEIAFQSDSLGILVDSCRVVTTLCWSSVGIFLLYKFLVWSARCVIVACQFIYRAISSVFKS